MRTELVHASEYWPEGGYFTQRTYSELAHLGAHPLMAGVYICAIKK